jgi:hypothetical protein
LHSRMVFGFTMLCDFISAVTEFMVKGFALEDALGSQQQYSK